MPERMGTRAALLTRREIAFEPAELFEPNDERELYLVDRLRPDVVAFPFRSSSHVGLAIIDIGLASP